MGCGLGWGGPSGWGGVGGIYLLEGTQRPVRDWWGPGGGEEKGGQEKLPVPSRKFAELIKLLKHKTRTGSGRDK